MFETAKKIRKRPKLSPQLPNRKSSAAAATAAAAAVAAAVVAAAAAVAAVADAATAAAVLRKVWKHVVILFLCQLCDSISEAVLPHAVLGCCQLVEFHPINPSSD